MDSHSNPIQRDGASASSQTWQHRLRHCLTALCSSAIIALLMLIPAHYQIFRSLDHLIFSGISAGLSQHGNDDYHAAVLEIDQAFYDEFFNGTSPLPRAQLGLLLETLLGEKEFFPAQNGHPLTRPLIIDLDISPRGDLLDRFDANRELSCAALPGDEFRVERALCAAKKRQIPSVLLVPFTADKDDALKIYRWMQFICANTHADFAFGDIPRTTDIYVTHYYGTSEGTQPPVLGNVARHLNRTTQKAGLCAAMKSEPIDDLPVAFAFLDRRMAATDAVNTVTLRKAIPINDTHLPQLDFRLLPRQIPLSGFFDQSEHPQWNVAALQTRIKGIAPDGPLFLGGTWDNAASDIFDTPRGPQPGVYLHALAGTGKFVHAVGHDIVIILEIVIGAILIGIFSALWRHAGHKLKAIDNAVNQHRSPIKIGALSGQYLLALLAIPLTSALLAFFVLLAATYFLFDFKWITPSAFLISILLKTYLERNASHEHQHGQTTAAKLYRSRYARVLEKTPFLLLLCWAIYLLIHDVFH